MTNARYVSAALAPDGTLALTTQTGLYKLDAARQQTLTDMSVFNSAVYPLSLAATNNGIFVGRVTTDLYNATSNRQGSIAAYWSKPVASPTAVWPDGYGGSREPRALCRQSDTRLLVAGSFGLIGALNLLPGTTDIRVDGVDYDNSVHYEGLWCNDEYALVVGSNNAVKLIKGSDVSSVVGPGPKDAQLLDVAAGDHGIFISGTSGGGSFVAESDGGNGWRTYAPLPGKQPPQGLALGPQGQVWVLQDGHLLVWTGKRWEKAFEPGIPLTTLTWNDTDIWLAGNGGFVFRLYAR